MILRFGIPSIDDLIDVRLPSQLEHPISPDGDAKQTNCATSIAILGPDGVGKSVLGLHRASRYLADFIASQKAHDPPAGHDLPRVLYISSDFRPDGAQKVWNAFKLNRPNR